MDMKSIKGVFVGLGLLLAALVITSTRVDAQAITPTADTVTATPFDQSSTTCIDINPIPTAADDGTDLTGIAIGFYVIVQPGIPCASGQATPGTDSSITLCCTISVDCTNPPTVSVAAGVGGALTSLMPDTSVICGQPQNQSPPPEDQVPADPVS